MSNPTNQQICAIGAAASLAESMGHSVVAKHIREFLAVCGKCRELIKLDALTGTTCACARGVVALPRDAYDTLMEKARRFDASSALPAEVIEARKAMLARLSDVQATDRQTGGTTFYDHEAAGYRARIFMAIDAEIERIDCARDEA